jgi:hypothetical protein
MQCVREEENKSEEGKKERKKKKHNIISPNRVPFANFCAVITIVVFGSSQSIISNPSGTEYLDKLSV